MFEVLHNGLHNPRALTILVALFFFSIFLLWIDWKRSSDK